MSSAESQAISSSQSSLRSPLTGHLQADLRGREMGGRRKEVFVVERIPQSIERPRKRMCVREKEERIADGGKRFAREGRGVRMMGREGYVNGYSPQSPSHPTPRPPLPPLPLSLPSDPLSALQLSDGHSILSALQRLQTRCSPRIDHPPGVPFWVYISTAYFPQLPSLPNECVSMVAGLGVERTGYGDSFEEQWEKVEERTMEQWVEARGRVERAYGELTEKVKEGRTRDQDLDDRLTSNAALQKQVLDPWTSLIYSSDFHSQLAHYSWLLDHSLPQPLDEESEGDINCEVCADGNFTEENKIVICSGCALAVHMKCYGVERLPEEDWFCEPCSLVDVLQHPSLPILCSICLRPGGALKSGLTPPVGTSGWAHIFCVETLPEAKFSIETSKEGVDLSKVDVRRCQMKCQLCGETRGACLQCSFRSCLSSFHPGCWKHTFVQPNGAIDSFLTCLKHRDSTLTQKLARLEKTRLREVQQFLRELCAADVGRKHVGKRKGVTKAEVRELARAAGMALKGHNGERRKLGFRIVVDCRERKVEVDSPGKWTVLSPEVFQAEQLSIPGRSSEESFSLYKDAYPRICRKAKVIQEFGLAEAAALKAQLVTAGVGKKRRGKRKRERHVIVRIPLRLILGFSPE